MRALLLLTMIGASLVACSDGEADGDGSDSASSTGPGGSASGGSGDGGAGQGGAPATGGAPTGGGGHGGSGDGGSSCTIPIGVEYDDMGCLTFDGASALCGFSSDDTICTTSVGCGTSSDDGQCKINCEMGTTVNCYTEEDVQCLVDAAACGDDCTALAACGFIL